MMCREGETERMVLKLGGLKSVVRKLLNFVICFFDIKEIKNIGFNKIKLNIKICMIFQK